MRKPTLRDVARAAGVSYATADRVLNARGGVAAGSEQRVRQAIADLGYVRDLHAANLSRGRVYRFVFVLPRGDHSFFQALRSAVEAQALQCRADRISISVQEVPALDPGALAAALRATSTEVDCLAVVATEAPEIAAALTDLRQRGLPVVTLVGDAAPDLRAAYAGIDNRMAGRTAGRLLALAHTSREGQILPVLGAFRARDHRDRFDGAAAVFTEAGSKLRLLPAIEVQDRPEVMRKRLSDALAEAANAGEAVTGIYSIGAGNRGLIDVLEGLEGPRPVVVLHELTPVSRAGLECGLIDAVIDQKPAEEVALAIAAMKALADGRCPEDVARAIVPAIYLPDNLPGAGATGGTP
ncbi:MAG: LacI family DNA-binding transcriptional regulator [Pararhodobacter sp.]|nr:LacI family DNA-binding transcriptional regulator [Pararhodobacter sp.]